jgi:superfamily II DNA or RNA helicase
MGRRLGYTSAKAAALARLLAQHRERRVIVFTGDNETAYRVAREHLIMPITCDIGRRERAAAVAAFQAGALRALVSSQVLNEGFDLPAADVGILIASTRGSREYVQRIGRLLRPAPGKRALVVELVTVATAEARRAWQRELELDAATLVR